MKIEVFLHIFEHFKGRFWEKQLKKRQYENENHLLEHKCPRKFKKINLLKWSSDFENCTGNETIQGRCNEVHFVENL